MQFAFSLSILTAGAAHPLRSEVAAWLFYIALSLCTFPCCPPRAPAFCNQAPMLLTPTSGSAARKRCCKAGQACGSAHNQRLQRRGPPCALIPLLPCGPCAAWHTTRAVALKLACLAPWRRAVTCRGCDATCCSIVLYRCKGTQQPGNHTHVHSHHSSFLSAALFGAAAAAAAASCTAARACCTSCTLPPTRCCACCAASAAWV